MPRAGSTTKDPIDVWPLSEEWLGCWRDFKACFYLWIENIPAASARRQGNRSDKLAIFSDAVGLDRGSLGFLEKAVGNSYTATLLRDHVIPALRASSLPSDCGLDEEVNHKWQEAVGTREWLANDAERQCQEYDKRRGNVKPAAPPAAVTHPPVTDRPINGPRLPRICELEAELEEDGNRGTPEHPSLYVTLSFGSGEPEEEEDGPVYLSLRNCSLVVESDGVVETQSLQQAVFHLEAPQSAPIDLVFEAGLRGKRWHGLPPASAGRVLRGGSDEQFLCSFSRSPSRLSVELRAAAHEFRFVDGKPDRQRDDVDRIVAMLGKRSVFQDAEISTGEYRLVRKPIRE